VFELSDKIGADLGAERGSSGEVARAGTAVETIKKAGQRSLAEQENRAEVLRAVRVGERWEQGFVLILSLPLLEATAGGLLLPDRTDGPARRCPRSSGGSADTARASPRIN
jgi:hypothetical protein